MAPERTHTRNRWDDFQSALSPCRNRFNAPRSIFEGREVPGNYSKWIRRRFSSTFEMEMEELEIFDRREKACKEQPTASDTIGTVEIVPGTSFRFHVTDKVGG